MYIENPQWLLWSLTNYLEFLYGYKTSRRYFFQLEPLDVVLYIEDTGLLFIKEPQVSKIQKTLSKPYIKKTLSGYYGLVNIEVFYRRKTITRSLIYGGPRTVVFTWHIYAWRIPRRNSIHTLLMRLLHIGDPRRSSD